MVGGIGPLRTISGFDDAFMKAKRVGSAAQGSGLSRRRFVVQGGAAATAFALAPRAVLGGPGYVAPSERVTVAYVGCGTQGLRELLPLLRMPEVQVVTVCDPVRDSQDYVDWSKDGLRSEIAAALGRPEWRRGRPGIPGGREVAKEIVEGMYGKERGVEGYRGCTAYRDFRELLEQEKDVQAVKVMTPDHLHAAVSVASLRKGKQVVLHKPLANRLNEARWVVETARAARVATHFLPASEGEAIRRIKGWIDAGAIGTLREIHNWSNRPVWPQYTEIPTERPPVPEGFDWELWLGPSVDRPYHPHYTHAVFRGWYEFGGGAIADMGHYSLWPVFQQFELDAPISVESRPSHVCRLDGPVAVTVRNEVAFPAACTVRFQFAAKGARPAVELHWYDGGMRPRTPEELEAAGEELEPEGLMLVGDRGRILARFLGDNARVIAGQRPGEGVAEAASAGERERRRERRTSSWVSAFRGGAATCGDFLLAGPISDAFNLAAVSLRMGGKRLVFDAVAGRVTNWPEANRYLGREYRPGWEWSGRAS